MTLHAQLELLLEIQDLHSQREGLSEESLREVESDLFDMQIEEALRLLDEKLVELEDRLETDVASRYRQMADKGMRAVVPVLSGICYGCFVAVPTAKASEAGRNLKIDICETCGRFLYHVV